MNYDTLISTLVNNNSDIIKKLYSDTISDKGKFQCMRFDGDGKNFSRTEIEIKKLELQLKLGFNIDNLTEEIVETTITNKDQIFHAGYLDYLLYAWKHHNGIIIGPWHIWNIILHNLKELNQQKPELTKKLYTMDDSTEKTQLNIYAAKFNINTVVDVLKKHIPENTFNTLLPHFPSAPINYNESMYGLLCEISYDYYDVLILCCGIPTVKLKGTIEEWNTLLDHVKQTQYIHSKLNSAIDNYLSQVYEITQDFVKNYHDEKYWLNFFEVRRCGSGSQSEVAGYCAKLFPTTILVNKVPQMVSNYMYKIVDPNNSSCLGKYISGIISSCIDDHNILVPQYNTITTTFYNNNNNSQFIPNDFLDSLKFINSCFRTPVGNREILEKEYGKVIKDYPKTVGLISAEEVTRELCNKTTGWKYNKNGELEQQKNNTNDEDFKKQLQHIQSIQEKNKGKTISKLLSDITTDTINRTKIFESFWFGTDSFISSEFTSERINCYNPIILTTFRYLQYLPKQEQYVQKVKSNIKQILEFYDNYSTTSPYYIPILATFNPEIIIAMINQLQININTRSANNDSDSNPNKTRAIEEVWNTVIIYLLFNAFDHALFRLVISETIDRTEHVGFICLSNIVDNIPDYIKQSCLEYISYRIQESIENLHQSKELRLCNLVLDLYSSNPDGFSPRFIGKSRQYVIKYNALNDLFGGLDKIGPIQKSIINMGYHTHIKLTQTGIELLNGMKLDYNILNIIDVNTLNMKKKDTGAYLDWSDENYTACIYFLKTYDTFNKDEYLPNYDNYTKHHTNKLHSRRLSDMIREISDYVFVIKLMEYAYEHLNVSDYFKKLSRILNESYYGNKGQSEFLKRQKKHIDIFFDFFELMSQPLKQIIKKSCKGQFDDYSQKVSKSELLNYTTRKFAIIITNCKDSTKKADKVKHLQIKMKKKEGRENDKVRPFL